MLRRWLGLLALGATVFIGASVGISALASHPAVRPVTQPGPLVVVGMPTLSWADVSPTRTPTLWSLAKRGAVAAQATWVLPQHSCSNQSWLTFSAGMPATFGHALGEPAPPGSSANCAQPLQPVQRPDGSSVFPRWGAWQHQARERGTPADIGRIGTLLAADGQCITAAGQYAALGAAGKDGEVTHYTPSTARVDLSACPVTFIGLQGPDDAYLTRLLRRLPASATILVTGMADDWLPSTLHAAVLAGPGVPHGLLTSLSTRQPGFVQTTDLSALVLSRLGADAPRLPQGRRPQVRPVAGPTTAIVQVSGLTRELNVEHAFVPWFVSVFLGVEALALLIGLAWWRRAGRRTPGLRRWFAVVAAMGASMPMATFVVGLVPWWHSAYPRAALTLAIVGISAVATALALLGPWRRWVAGPMAFLMGTTLFVITEDVVHGSRLQFTSLLGLQPVYGGRYFGQGNVGYAIYATTALLLAAVLAGRVFDAGHRRLAAVTVAVIGLAAVIVDGFPVWGADGGGPVAMIPAFCYLALNAAGLSVTWKRIAVIVGSTIAVVGGFAVLDYLRPPRYRTHLGDFVASLRHTGQPTGLERIWTQNWSMLTANWLNMSVALLLLATMLVLLAPHVLGRPLQPVLSQVTFLGHGLAAVAVCWLLAFLSNDSGTGIPPCGLLVAAPLLILLAACLPASPDAETPQRGTPHEIPRPAPAEVVPRRQSPVATGREGSVTQPLHEPG